MVARGTVQAGSLTLAVTTVAASKPSMENKAKVPAEAIAPALIGTGLSAAASSPRPNRKAATRTTASNGTSLSTVVTSWTAPAARAPRMLTKVNSQTAAMAAKGATAGPPSAGKMLLA